MRFSHNFAAGKDSRACISKPAWRFIMFYTAKHFNSAASTVICDVVWLSLARKCVKAGAAVSTTLRSRKCRRVRRKAITMWVDKSIIFSWSCVQLSGQFMSNLQCMSHSSDSALICHDKEWIFIRTDAVFLWEGWWLLWNNFKVCFSW